MDELHRKQDALGEKLKELGKVAVAFSGGVDSAFLLQSAVEALGRGNVVAVMANLNTASSNELEEALAFCIDRRIPHAWFDFDAFDVDGFAGNPPDRCYRCKKDLLGGVVEIAESRGFEHILEGSNADDLEDYRPGYRAVKDLGVHSPLLECGLTKDEIRELSHEMGLPTWNKPSLACLASRFAFNEPITKERLEMVDRAEQMLHGMGLTQVRVRVHGEGDGAIARIETLPEEMHLIAGSESATKVANALKDLGFAYVSLDLSGYRTGSMARWI